MNEHTLKGDWKQMKGTVKQKWADLTDDDLLHIEGSRDKLVGKVQERYGHSKDDAEREVDAWRVEKSDTCHYFSRSLRIEACSKSQSLKMIGQPAISSWSGYFPFEPM